MCYRCYLLLGGDLLVILHSSDNYFINVLRIQLLIIMNSLNLNCLVYNSILHNLFFDYSFSHQKYFIFSFFISFIIFHHHNTVNMRF